MSKYGCSVYSSNLPDMPQNKRLQIGDPSQIANAGEFPFFNL